MEIERNSNLFSQVSSLLNKKTFTSSDFAYLKSIPPSDFELIIEKLPQESTAKILEYLKNDPSDSIKKPHSFNKPPKNNTQKIEPSPFLEGFYAKGMFKHLWLEDVKKIHQSLLPTVQNNTKIEVSEKKPDFPSQMSLETIEKKPTFLNILCKMAYVFGDPRQDNMVCAQKLLETVQKTIETLLDSHVLSRIFALQNKRPQKKLHKKQIFHQFLQGLYPLEYKKFSQIKELSSKTVFPENFVESEESEEDSMIFIEKSPTKEEKTIENKDFEAINLRIDAMTQEEYIEFSHCRTLNFLSLGKEAFIDLIGFKKIHENFFKELRIMHFYSEIEFINYILCRLVKNIVESSVKKINKGTLHPLKISLPLDIVGEMADNELISLSLKVKKYIKKKTSIEEKAFKLFSKEFWTFEYDKILSVFNTKIKLLKQNDDEFSIHEEEKQGVASMNAQQIWKSMRNWQKYWIQRILAESSIKKNKNLKESPQNIEYLNYLYEKMKENEEIDKGSAFKEWFVMKIQGVSRTKPMKKTQKLESIFD